MRGLVSIAPKPPGRDVNFRFGRPRETPRHTQKIFVGRSIGAIIAEAEVKRYNFTIIASGIDATTPRFEDRFFEAGCDDATISFQKGRLILEFEREARNFSHALVSALIDVGKTGAKVVHIEPDYLVSLSDIAERSGRTRASTSLFAKGNRGKDFPAPIARITSESPLWDWVQVAQWMFKRKSIALDTLLEAKIVKAANRAISETNNFEQSAFARKILSERREQLRTY
jgi:hypothetical protein